MHAYRQRTFSCQSQRDATPGKDRKVPSLRKVPHAVARKEPRARNKERPPGADDGAWLMPERKWGPRSYHHKEGDSSNNLSGPGSIWFPRASRKEFRLANTRSALGDVETWRPGDLETWRPGVEQPAGFRCA